MNLRSLKIKNICAIVIVFISLFLYIFNILPIVGPEKVGTREYLSIPASFFVLMLLSRLPKVYFWIVLANWTQVLFSIIAVIGNGTTDFWYVQFAIRNVLYINGAVLIAYLMPKKWSLDTLMLLVIAAIIVNDVISFIGFVNPTVASFLFSIQDFGNMEKVERSYGFGTRIIGLGRNNYFNGGVTNGMGIILAFYLISQKKLNQYLGLVIIFIMTIIGLFIARTTIVGLLLGGSLYLVTLKRKTYLIKALISVSILLVMVYVSGVLDGLNTSHAFELFEYYDDLDKVESLNKMNSMYDRDMSFTTFLFGDGLSKDGEFYYMHTDVGYLRNIFYFGILGTVLGYFYYEYYILRKLFDYNRELKMIILTLAVYLLALNLKGLPDYNFLIFILLAYYIRQNGNKRENNSIINNKRYRRLLNETQTKLAY